MITKFFPLITPKHLTAVQATSLVSNTALLRSSVHLSVPRRCHEAREAKRGVYVVGTRALEQTMNGIFAVEYTTVA
ncbi:hypothetical protein [Paenibacillus endoradicis]|uniref:hypothetical protein n=1 Tax=Paenibacillus endoradicis TaxID=2972487 RepID=UPI002158F8BA|nr:hypothetical protein [Paenibacillus endoradicis]MCR8657336.1 hypothetical protein [Paenibacillus endoradicis]